MKLIKIIWKISGLSQYTEKSIICIYYLSYQNTSMWANFEYCIKFVFILTGDIQSKIPKQSLAEQAMWLDIENVQVWAKKHSINTALKSIASWKSGEIFPPKLKT